MSDMPDGNAGVPVVPGGDPLAALLDGLHRLSSGEGAGVPSGGAVGLPATFLSNGFNADAGVAQLVSALASLVDGHGAFNATPFAAPSDPSPQGVLAAALR